MATNQEISECAQLSAAELFLQRLRELDEVVFAIYEMRQVGPHSVLWNQPGPKPVVLGAPGVASPVPSVEATAPSQLAGAEVGDGFTQSNATGVNVDQRKASTGIQDEEFWNHASAAVGRLSIFKNSIKWLREKLFH